MGRRPCCEKEGLNRGAWTAQEDQILTDYIRQNGEGRWRNLPNKAGLKRCGKSCRLRWLNYLRPDIKRGNISPDEEELIIRLHKLLGNRWSLIAGRLPGRTDNEIKNYWNTNLVKKVQQSHQLPVLIPNATPSSSQISPNDEKTTESGLVRTRASRSSNEVFVAAQLANPDAASPSTRTTTAETATDPRQPNLREEDHNNTDNSNLTDLVLDFNIGDLCLSDLLDSSDLSSPSPACSCDHQPDALFYETGEASNNTMLDFNVQPFVPFLGYYTEGEWLE